MIKAVLFSLLSFLLVHDSIAAMTSFGFAGIVKSFDAETAVVEVQGSRISVPRKQIITSQIKSGDSVFFQLDQDQMNRLFNKKHASESN